MLKCWYFYCNNTGLNYVKNDSPNHTPPIFFINEIIQIMVLKFLSVLKDYFLVNK